MGIFRSSARRADIADMTDETARGGSGGGGGAATAVASALALLFSAYSLYDGAIRRPDLHTFVPPVIFYASANPRDNFEVFEVPVTIVNQGARTGTILSMDLEVSNPRNKAVKHFYAGGFGHFPGVNEPFPNFKPFAPVSEPGKASSSDNLLFYSRFEEKVLQVVEEKGLYKFKLTAQLALSDDLGPLEKLLQNTPAPLEFEMEMPEKDFRAFERGALALHAPGWRVAAPAKTTAAAETPAADDKAN